LRVFIFFFLALNAHYFSAQQDVKKLDELIQNWHKAASEAKFDIYFNCLTDDFIFLGPAPG
jgi:ketosteroid isomerase-like protein